MRKPGRPSPFTDAAVADHAGTGAPAPSPRRRSWVHRLMAVFWAILAIGTATNVTRKGRPEAPLALRPDRRHDPAVFAHDLHLRLALASLTVMGLVAAEGAVRLVAARPPGRLAAAGSATVTILLGMTATAGLALLLGGRRPNEWLHLVYALVALGVVPFADSLAVQASARRRALARLLGGLVAVVVVARLFATG